MKRFLIVALSAISLSGCFWNDAGELDLDTAAKNFRTGMVEACNYAPTVASATAIVAAGNLTVAGVAAAVTAACLKISESWGTMPLYSSPDCLKVNGVCLEGEFVAPKTGD